MSLLKRIYLGVVFVFLYAPIFMLVVYSFNQSKFRGHWSGFTFNWYVELFKDMAIMSSLKWTVLLAILSTIISVILGVFATLAICNMGKTKNLIIKITYLPILNSDVVTGVSLMLLFFFMKIPFGFVTLLLSHVIFGIPYVIVSILHKLQRARGGAYEAALDLGASPMYAFFYIVLPEIVPNLINGALIVFTMSIDDFVISFFTAGAGISNLSMTVYSMARRGVKPSLNALATLMFMVMLLLLFIINLREAESE